MHPTYVALNEETLETGAWSYGVHRTCTEMAAVSRGTSHATTKQRCRYTTTVDIQIIYIYIYIKLRAIERYSLILNHM